MLSDYLSRRQFAKIAGVAAFGALIPGGRVWAGADRTLRFAFSNGSPPYTSDLNGKCSGILVDLLNLVFEHTPNFDFKCEPFSWARAQHLVQSEEFDGLCTYPSEKRKAYLNFSPEPVFVQDMGFLAYAKKKAGIQSLTEVGSYADLSRFEFIGVNGVGWEVDNIPPNIRRQLVTDLETAFALLLKRQSGDFVVISVEQGTRMARNMGFGSDDLGFVRAEFITNHLVPYHIGLRKNLPGSAEIIARITDVIRSSGFQNQRKKILAEYTL